MKKSTVSFLLLTTLCAAVVFAQDGWTRYSSKKFGFSMLIPTGTQMLEKEAEGGWAGAHGEHDGVIFEGIAKMGKATQDEIAAFGVRYTGIEESRWSKIDGGDGWTVYMAEKGDQVLLASTVVGTKAGFLLFLRTTKK